jgi:hypothetical protein
LGAISDIAYNGKMYIAFDNRNNMLKSSDGINWNIEEFKNFAADEQSKEANYDMGNAKKVVWDGNQFVVLHVEGISKSKDGVNWTSHRIENGNCARLELFDIAYNKDKYIIIGQNWDEYKLALFYSDDCENWKKSEVKDAVTCLFGERPLYTAAWNGKEFIAMGNAGAAAKSYDGVNWVGFKSKTYLDANQIIWDGNQFIAVGVIPYSLSDLDENCDVGAIFTSKDGTNWTRSFSKKQTEFNDIQWNGNKYIVLGSRNNLDEGETFDMSSGLLFSSGGKIISSDKGVVLISQDGQKWNYKEVDSKFSTLVSDNNVFLISEGKFVKKEGQEEDKSCKFYYVDFPTVLNND